MKKDPEGIKKLFRKKFKAPDQILFHHTVLKDKLKQESPTPKIKAYRSRRKQVVAEEQAKKICG